MPALSAIPAVLNLSLYAGDGFAATFLFTDKDTGLPWVPVGTWTAQIRETAAADTVVASFTINTSASASGTLTLSLSGVQTRALPASAVWDLEQIEAGAQPKTWYRGTVQTSQDVTRV